MIALCAVLLLLLGASGVDAAKLTAAEGPQVVPESVRELLNAKADDGSYIIGEDERKYFGKLPEHAIELTAAAVDDDMIEAPEHLAKILALRLSSQKYELVMRDNCFLCHTNEEEQELDTLFSTDPGLAGSNEHLNLKEFVSDVHFRDKLSCSGCHGGSRTRYMDHRFPKMWPDDRDSRMSDRSWIPEFCSRCHSNAGVMRRFNPSLPTDQLMKYRESMHGKRLLEQKDSRAAQCVSCHGVHGIRDAKSPASKVYAKNVPGTCGRCHADANRMAGFTLADGTPLPTNQLEQYRSSVHGIALLERGDTGAPACNDCHGNHAAMPPETTSVSRICRTCHVNNGSLFDGSKHKEMFRRNGWPECEKCHGRHDIAKTNDAMLNTDNGGMCVECHERYAKDNPDCIATASYFYESITELSSILETLGETSEELASRGLDIDPITGQLDILSDALKQSRSRIHAFNMSDFRQALAPGKEAIHETGTLLEEAEDEYNMRRRGLLVSLVLMGIVGGGIYVKLRSFEAEQRRRDKQARDKGA